MADLVKVADLADVPPGEIVLVDFQGNAVALANLNGTIYAFSDECTHMAGRLSQGMLENTVATCPLHRGQFDVSNGAVVAAPPTETLPTYDVQVSPAGEILLSTT